MTRPVSLAHRSVISVSGADAETFLNAIVTASTAGLRAGEFRYGGLLTPQGKLIADMLLMRDEDAILIDCAETAAAAVAKRLTMMKLRAAVSISLRDDLGVIAFDGLPDPRSSLAPARRVGPSQPAGDMNAYHAARIEAGLPEQGFDFGSEEVFPADINMDLVGGVDFKKGCFVGQEVVSRMKRRGTARRRTLRVSLEHEAQTPCQIFVAGVEVGKLTSAHGRNGLARVRIDEVETANKWHEAHLEDGALVNFDIPEWLAGQLAAILEARRQKRTE